MRATRVDRANFTEDRANSLRELEWMPNLEQVKAWADQKVREHKLVRVMYYLTPSGEITRLTFVFSNGVLAPAATTYNFKASRQLLYPEKEDVSALEFELSNGRLYTFSILGPNKQPLEFLHGKGATRPDLKKEVI